MKTWRCSSAPHVFQFPDADIGHADTKHVRPLDGAPYPALGDHLQHPGVDEQGHVAVKTGRRHIGEFGAEGARCQGTVSKESLDYPQSDGVQQQLSRGHAHDPNASISTLLTFLFARTSTKGGRVWQN